VVAAREVDVRRAKVERLEPSSPLAVRLVVDGMSVDGEHVEGDEHDRD
jgi:hypothetical protein